MAAVVVFQEYAAALRLDAQRFSACYARPEPHPRTQRANAVAEGLGMRATPTFVIDGRAVEGALPLPQFRQLLDAYNYTRPLEALLEALRGLTPYEFTCRTWADEPHRFTRDPTHDTVGPNIQA